MSGHEIDYPATLEGDGDYIKQQATDMVNDMASLFAQIEMQMEALPQRLNVDLSDWYTRFHNDMMSIAQYWYQFGDLIATTGANAAQVDAMIAKAASDL